MNAADRTAAYAHAMRDTAQDMLDLLDMVRHAVGDRESGLLLYAWASHAARVADMASTLGARHAPLPDIMRDDLTLARRCGCDPARLGRERADTLLLDGLMRITERHPDPHRLERLDGILRLTRRTNGENHQWTTR